MWLNWPKIFSAKNVLITEMTNVAVINVCVEYDLSKLPDADEDTSVSCSRPWLNLLARAAC